MSVIIEDWLDRVTDPAEQDEFEGLVDADTPDDVVDVIIELVDAGITRSQIMLYLATRGEVN